MSAHVTDTHTHIHTEDRKRTQMTHSECNFAQDLLRDHILQRGIDIFIEFVERGRHEFHTYPTVALKHTQTQRESVSVCVKRCVTVWREVRHTSLKSAP